MILHHPDGLSGFGVMQDVVTDVFVSVLLSAALIAVGFWFLPTNGGVVIAGTVGIIWTLTLPVFVVPPFVLPHRLLRQAKQRLRGRLHGQLNSAVGGGLTAGLVQRRGDDAELLLDLLRDAEQVRTHPISFQAAWLYFAAYIWFLAIDFIRFIARVS